MEVVYDETGISSNIYTAMKIKEMRYHNRGHWKISTFQKVLLQKMVLDLCLW